MAPWTSGWRKFLAKTLVTSWRSAALSENASTFVRHLTVLLLIKRCPGVLILLPSAVRTKIPCSCSNGVYRRRLLEVWLPNNLKWSIKNWNRIQFTLKNHDIPLDTELCSRNHVRSSSPQTFPSHKATTVPSW
jgi:hypothetical protein